MGMALVLTPCSVSHPHGLLQLLCFPHALCLCLELGSRGLGRFRETRLQVDGEVVQLKRGIRFAKRRKGPSAPRCKVNWYSARG